MIFDIQPGGIFAYHTWHTVLVCMALVTVPVFVALLFIGAGYGRMYNKWWGPTINNRWGWMLMEAPSFVGMLLLWLCSDRVAQAAPAVMACLFLLHYAQRTFVFPMLIRGRGKMPLSIMAMSIVFNLLNVYLIGGWLFYIAPSDYYDAGWLLSPQFICGTLLFFWGMYTNIQSDSIIRHLRKPGMTGHYIPRGGMFRYVTCANYLGEVAEWVGYAILTWSAAGAVFALWTFANLAPRAVLLHRRYVAEFGQEYSTLNRRRIIPFIF